MRIAIVGTRGIPANYGGFETFAEELGVRLVDRGHEVVVYCRATSYERQNFERHWRGIDRIRIAAPKGKYLETVISTLLALIHVTIKGDCNAVILVNGINAALAWIPRLRRIPVLLNVDGIERQRDKWSWLGKAAYLASEYLTRWTPTVAISDAVVVAEYYLERHRLATRTIAYGAPVQRSPDTSWLAAHHLSPDQYILFVSRLEPENGADLVIQAYEKVESDLPLLIVGDSPYADSYKANLHDLAARDTRVRMMGAIYDVGYRALQEGARIYVQATSVGGTHPALIEAMGAGNAVVARDTPEHREVLRDAGRYFKNSAELSATLSELLENPETIEILGSRASQIVQESFAWDSVVTSYESILDDLCRA